MRLLMITQDFPPETGGIQTYSISHAKHLGEECEWFGVVCPDKPGADAVDKGLKFPVYRLKIRNDLLVLSLLKNLKPLLIKHPAEVLFHTQWQTVAPSIRAKRRGLIRNIFAAAHIRELLFNPYESVPVLGKLFLRYRNWVLKNIDHFYPVSEYTAATLRSLGVDESKITVVINGTDPDQFYPTEVSGLKKELGLQNKRIILTITRLVPRKGIDTVLQALGRVCEEIPDAHYLIVGDGEDRSRLDSLVREYGLSEKVTFSGRVPYEEINRYYNTGDLFVMPSRTRKPDIEGFGIVFLEANACGLPVIGSDSGGIPSAIKNGETGYIVPEGDAGQLAEKMISLLQNPSLSSRLGENGRKWVLDEANWNAVSKQLIDDIRVRLGR